MAQFLKPYLVIARTWKCHWFVGADLGTNLVYLSQFTWSAVMKCHILSSLSNECLFLTVWRLEAWEQGARTVWLWCGSTSWLPSYCSFHGGEREGGSFPLSLIKALKQSWRLHDLWPNCVPKTLLQIPSQWGLKFQQTNFEVTQITLPVVTCSLACWWYHLWIMTILSLSQVHSSHFFLIISLITTSSNVWTSQGDKKHIFLAPESIISLLRITLAMILW
jgi:hypothetical protein